MHTHAYLHVLEHRRVLPRQGGLAHSQTALQGLNTLGKLVDGLLLKACTHTTYVQQLHSLYQTL